MAKLPDWLEKQLQRQKEEKMMERITGIRRVTIELDEGDYFIEPGIIHRDIHGTLEGGEVVFTIIGRRVKR